MTDPAPTDFLLLKRCCSTPKPLGQICREAALPLSDHTRQRMRHLKHRGIVRWEEHARDDNGEPITPGYVLTSHGEDHLDYLWDRYGTRGEAASDPIGHPTDALLPERDA